MPAPYRPLADFFPPERPWRGVASDWESAVRAVLAVPDGDRTRTQVQFLRDEAAGGCCNRFADVSGCDCLDNARAG